MSDSDGVCSSAQPLITVGSTAFATTAAHSM
jgi:hypothetical protein